MFSVGENNKVQPFPQNVTWFCWTVLRTGRIRALCSDPSSKDASSLVHFIAAISSSLWLQWTLSGIMLTASRLSETADLTGPLGQVKSFYSRRSVGGNTNCHFGRAAHDTFSLFVVGHELRSVVSRPLSQDTWGHSAARGLWSEGYPHYFNVCLHHNIPPLLYLCRLWKTMGAGAT